MNYDVDYFIKKFEAIPEELWTAGVFKDGERRCAAGHCGAVASSNWKNIPMVVSLYNLPFDGPEATITAINDGNHTEYKQPTPKQRVLAALWDLKNGS